MIDVTVVGANGRMGKTLCALVEKDTDMRLCYAVVRKTCALKAPFTDDLALAVKKANVVIDFTTPALTTQTVQLCERHNTTHIVGTTGLSFAQEHQLKKASKNIPIVYAANFSLGVNILLNMSKKLASILPAHTFDAEIMEMHHNRKVDCPSGTALAIGKAIATGRNVELQSVKCDKRSGNVGKRPQGEIGFSTIRGGNIVGEHTVMFLGEHESVELTHKSHSRTIFANGAIFASKWASKKTKGMYSMQDVLHEQMA